MQSTPESSPVESPRRLRFSRGSRLLKNPSFEAVYKNGRRQFSSSMTFFYFLRPEDQAAGRRAERARVGFTVGRPLGGAVERNRIKRRVRDAVRLNLPALNQALAQRALLAEIVINPKKSAMNSKTLKEEVARAFEVIASAKEGAASQGNARPQVKK
jgi:ribonuclease P protein component